MGSKKKSKKQADMKVDEKGGTRKKPWPPPNETEEQRRERLRKHAARMRLRRAQMTEEEKKALHRREAERFRRMRARQSQEQKAAKRTPKKESSEVEIVECIMVSQQKPDYTWVECQKCLVLYPPDDLSGGVCNECKCRPMKGRLKKDRRINVPNKTSVKEVIVENIVSEHDVIEID